MKKIVGFGGAFTEAAAHNFHKLSATAQAKFLEAYFGEEGIAYTLGRIHINSCDFSLESYNFNDVKDDFKVRKAVKGSYYSYTGLYTGFIA